MRLDLCLLTVYILCFVLWVCLRGWIYWCWWLIVGLFVAYSCFYSVVCFVFGVMLILVFCFFGGAVCVLVIWLRLVFVCSSFVLLLYVNNLTFLWKVRSWCSSLLLINYFRFICVLLLYCIFETFFWGIYPTTND